MPIKISIFIKLNLLFFLKDNFLKNLSFTAYPPNLNFIYI